MSGLYFGDNIRLKSYSALTKGGKSVIKIELETSDHYDLASILRQLDEIERELAARVKSAKSRSSDVSKKALLALPPPPLQIPYFGEAE